MIFASSIPLSPASELLDLLEAVACSRLDEPLPQCGRWLRYAKDAGLVHASEDLEPILLTDGLALLKEHRPC